MEAYDIWLFAHIAAAILWVGGSTALGIMMGRLQKAQAGPALGAVGEQMEFFSKAFFMPASLLAVVSGFGLVLSSDAWNFEDPWIAAGVAGFVLTLVVGMAVLGPTAKKISTLGAERGPADPEVAALRERMKRFSGVNLVILWVVVLVMVLKPGA